MLKGIKVGRDRTDYGVLRAGCFQYQTRHVGNIIAAVVEAVRQTWDNDHPYYVTRREVPIAVVTPHKVVRLSSDILRWEEEDVCDAIRYINRRGGD